MATETDNPATGSRSKKKSAQIDEKQSAESPVVFEDALSELEKLVIQMEAGDLSLNDSLKAFERGVKLARLCQTALKEAELKVQMLNADGQLTDLVVDED